VDELYVIARRVLLDALDALGEHRDATILVGAQAIYLHTGDADLGVAEYTTDADLALDPELLAEVPPLEQALEGAGFHGSSSAVGIWKTRRRTSDSHYIDVQVDLLVPATVSPGTGRRAARLPGHGVHAARKVDGLEGVLVDLAQREIASLEPAVDPRVLRAKVAGPGALLIAKMFKIHERRGSPRANDKDALDVLRILQGIPTEDLARRLASIRGNARSATTGERALELFAELFGNRGGEGAVMAARATQPVMDADQVRLTCEVLAGDLLEELKR
jgi:hypothetical protein